MNIRETIIKILEENDDNELAADKITALWMQDIKILRESLDTALKDKKSLNKSVREMRKSKIAAEKMLFGNSVLHKSELWSIFETHMGHNLTIAGYGSMKGEIQDLCLECEDCNEVIISLEEVE